MDSCLNKDAPPSRWMPRQWTQGECRGDHGTFEGITFKSKLADMCEGVPDFQPPRDYWFLEDHDGNCEGQRMATSESDAHGCVCAKPPPPCGSHVKVFCDG